MPSGFVGQYQPQCPKNGEAYVIKFHRAPLPDIVLAVDRIAHTPAAKCRKKLNPR